ncbi:hypothetical protein FNF27_03041 [Cafeteria roenbergensis]|uniref:ER membrane protein complex subunit 2 n=1 Tax=Cafeteria roenbergensis TaxID=33653 RepID=A0A5A8EDG8_CAFRO|nr:hypothetical protein FNF29_05107 [Cafeteria roenbergensis]KAA0152243.1 hypothetical protein FNF31_06674 [Cafeteria roenbergensis]KAA0154632.1 hypothetical protein FNF28_06808 [Cafeteria roenbergensis]KAA0175338.1 hypothetical protein FNF27_03041 [Cafeteria roenbergensis]|eukprot:KAA0150772.1 hypothetical protein FNF29_05107 [Cafeteria roenbergensis]
MDALLECAAKGSSLSRDEGVKTLRLAKERGLVLRAPQKVANVAQTLIATGSLSDDERLAAAEMLIEGLVRAPSAANLDLALDTVTGLEERFPMSQRVGRLRAMFEEARGRIDASFEGLAAVLEANSSNMIASRRLVALHSRDGVVSAVRALNEHLETFASDVTAWVQLGEAHMSCGRFRLAAFCFSECVLLMPASHHMHRRVGECLLSAAAAADEDADERGAGKARRSADAGRKSAKKGRSTAARRREDAAVAAAAGAVEEAGAAGPDAEPLALQARRHLAQACRVSDRGDASALLMLIKACQAVADSADCLTAAAKAVADASTPPGAAGIAAGLPPDVEQAAKDNGAMAVWALRGLEALLPADALVLAVAKRAAEAATATRDA